VTQNTVKGFADLHYDKAPSPLTAAGGGTNSFLGPGGIVSALDAFVQNPVKGAFGLFRSYEKNKNVDLKGLAKAELLSAGMDILNGKDPRDRFFVPSIGSLASRPSSGGTSIAGLAGAASGSVNSNGSSISLGTGLLVGGAALALSGKPELGAGVAIAGLITNSKGQVTGGTIDKTVNIEKPTDTSNAAIASAALQAVSSSSPLDFLSFGGALLKVSQERAAKAKAEEVKQAQQQQATNTATAPTNAGILSSIQGIQGGVPAFLSGTNSITNPSGASLLAQTPYASTVVPAQAAVAGSEANQFIQNGNPQRIGGGYGNFTSTNPAPPTVTI
jgi:hypothetical protein